MSRGGTPALFVAALVLLGCGDARADESIARRLGALKALVSPEAASAAIREEGRPPGACAAGAWWRLTDYGVQARIDTAVRHASLRFAVEPALIRAVIHHESRYGVRAVSPRGAQGLMQLMPETARELGVVCPFEPRENVLAGTRYLRRLYDRFGDWPRALAAYHAGPSRVSAGRIPGVTRRYVRAVVASWRPQLLAWIDLD